MDNVYTFSEEELEKVNGGLCGLANPVAGLTEEEARKIAAELGEGKNMGTWGTMSGEQFMEWWRKSNGK